MNKPVAKWDAQFFLTEFMAYLSQVVVVFLVAAFSSNFLSDQKKLEAFGNAKVSSITPGEIGFTLLALVVWCGVLLLAQILVGGRLWRGVIRDTLYEFPRIVYLIGSTATGVAISIALYLSNHPAISGWAPGQWWMIALIMSCYGFGLGFVTRVIVKSRLEVISRIDL
jgi:hypothetical protein